jgi:CDP-glycerol glycerophosphotransferase (TagB/SpsB family)
MIRYHFMYKEKTMYTGEYIYQFMDFQEHRIVRGTLEDFKNSDNEKLKEDFREQWKRIDNSQVYDPFKNKK